MDPKDIARLITEDPDIFNEDWEELGIEDPGIIDPKDIKAHTISNYDEINNSDLCGCLYCGKIFKPSNITKWLTTIDGQIYGSYTSKKTGSAECPWCGMPDVVGDASGYDINPKFLDIAHKVLFGSSNKLTNKELGKLLQERGFKQLSHTAEYPRRWFKLIGDWGLNYGIPIRKSHPGFNWDQVSFEEDTISLSYGNLLNPGLKKTDVTGGQIIAPDFSCKTYENRLEIGDEIANQIVKICNTAEKL